ncbi:ComEA family DNA-binding protein [Methylobacterium sp. J-068]|uniref:ComEA family DNA-binding protein n=1 Tax=Methylobacterium sp. J-068 TaxID=2836649 RepID=UPI001FBBFC4B|nr:helix-hairpin-helix domain-containing protein [Methylobacterium sp. J-068]MCJ2035976.1 helix-hairpin-helix domain-containing protein [Methylobacterium sp. J-068]
MLSGSAFLRVGILVVVAAVLAGVIQVLRPRESGTSEAPVTRTAPETGKAGTQAARPPAATRPAVPVDPAPPRQVAPPPAPSPQALPPQALPPQVPEAPQAAAPAPMPVVPAPNTPVPAPANRPATPMTGDEAIDNAAETAGPRGIAIVDLNTGSVAELNALKGGGMIGRAIVQKRPYGAVSELLSKRVLSRAVYERIKEQVTVR